jgi:hypothetical protein
MGKLGGFFLSKYGNTERSTYSAFAKGFAKLSLNGYFHNPCFSGTGLSLDAFQSETSSALAKPLSRSFAFTELPIMSTKEVTLYLKDFLDLEGLGQDLVEHVANWLRGRPKWTASFLEESLKREPATKNPTVARGRFSEGEVSFINALNRYIDIITQPKDIVHRRHSLDVMRLSAYAAASRIFEQKGADWSEAQR